MSFVELGVTGADAVEADALVVVIIGLDVMLDASTARSASSSSEVKLTGRPH